MFTFADDAFSIDRDWTLDFCDEYRRRVGLPYTVNVLIDQLDDEIAAALHRSGALAKVGMESGTERIRCSVLGKSFDNHTLERGMSILRRHGPALLRQTNICRNRRITGIKKEFPDGLLTDGGLIYQI